MNAKLKHGLQEAFEAPAPVRKKEFFAAICQPGIGNLSFVWMQAAYIPKYVWGISGAVFMAALAGGCFFARDVLWVICALIPFVALSVITESARSDVFLMSELEMAARFSLKSVLLARMAVLGISHLCLLVFLVPVCAACRAISVFQTGLYVLAPYLLTVSAGLWAVRRTRGMEGVYLCMGIAVCVSGMGYFARNIFPALYEPGFTPAWAAVSAGLLILVIREMRKNVKQTEELAWNLS